VSLSEPLKVIVDHTVDHMVPVDLSTLLLLAVVLLELLADGVPVTGIEPETQLLLGTI
jgi:hypothetical protein